MHTLHTINAFILQSFPHGESNRTYKLLTREKGLLYAHGQAVRELKSRNRYALQTGQMSEITLVRGREVWRITGAKVITEARMSRVSRTHTYKILHLVGGLLAIEDPVQEIFDVLQGGNEAFCSHDESTAPLIEVVTMLRLMDKLGFMARPSKEPLIETFLDAYNVSDEVLGKVAQHKKVLIQRINSALEEAK
jgi:recombinational DNA repair protein (RecF pathway)